MTSKQIELNLKHSYYYEKFVLSRGNLSLMDKHIRDILKHSGKLIFDKYC